MTPSLFIGMPVFNGEQYISEAIDSLLSQTYTDWVLLISDNRSDDRTEIICRKYLMKDKRIQYIKQENNIGAMQNFQYLLNKTTSPYFMWAASDDRWKKNFISECMKGLCSKEYYSWAFTNMVNIDSFGKKVRDYPSFNIYMNSDRYVSIANFILSPEIMGKSNLIYGIYDLNKLKNIMINLLKLAQPNFDMFDLAFNLGILCHTKLFICNEILFEKRFVRIVDSPESTDTINVFAPYITGGFNQSDFVLYKKILLKACQGTKYFSFVSSLLDYRENLQFNLDIFTKELIEQATWEFAKWPWLKKWLKFIRTQRNKIFKNNTTNYDKS